MDKTYRKTVIGMIIPTALAAVIVGGDALLNDPKLATNISILEAAISFVISPVMVITFIFFLVTVIKFIKNAKKAKREAA